MLNNKFIKLLLLGLMIIIFTIHQPAFATQLPHVSESQYDMKKGIRLEGNWLFFANQFYFFSKVKANLEEGKLVQLPAKYKDTMKDTEGYGTFAIKVNLPIELIGTIQAIRMPYQHAAIDLYVDNLKVLSAGQIAKEQADYTKMQNNPIAYFEVKQSSFYVIIHFSSFGMLKSGFINTIEIGDPTEQMKHKQKDYYLVVFLLGILLVVGLFCMFIGFIDKKQRIFLIFGVFSLVVMLRCVIAVPFLYNEMVLPFNITTSFAVRSEYLLSLIIGFLFMIYLVHLYKHLFNKYVVKLNLLIYLVTTIVMIALPVHKVTDVFFVFVAIQAILLSYLLKILYQAYKLKLSFARMNIITVLILASSLVFELLAAYNIVPAGPYVLFVLTLISVMLAYEFGKYYVLQLKKLNNLNQQLFVMNNSLDELVQKRTDELTLLNMKLQQQAIIDGLTGIYNRSYFNDKLEEWFNKAKRNKESLALIIFDIDEFKQYNDCHGHLKGDKILIDIVHIVKEQLPPHTVFARYGGEEFVILFNNYSEKEVQHYCELLRLAVEEAGIDHMASKHKYVTISIGGAFMRAEKTITNANQLLEHADKQLYVSKGTGKNKASFS